MTYVTQRPLVKGSFARISNGEVVAEFPFQFNPTEMNRTLSATWLDIGSPGSPAPRAVFAETKAQKIKLTLLFDKTEGYVEEKQGVRAQLSEAESYVNPDLERYSASLGQYISPPRVLLAMGTRSWEVVVDSVDIQEVRWNRDLIPTRAFVTFNMRSPFSSLAAVQTYFDSLASFRNLATGGSAV